MGRPAKLTDFEAVTKVVQAYKKLDKPTLVAYCRMLKVDPVTLYKRMEGDDNIADELIDGWSHLLETWESNLYSKDLKIPAIFYLKTIRRFGYRWCENENVTPENTQGDHKVTLEIVNKSNAESTSK